VGDVYHPKACLLISDIEVVSRDEQAFNYPGGCELSYLLRR